ncbi:MAG: glycosyltransferase family 9 protein [Alphaproteobacteria bacterium]
MKILFITANRIGDAILSTGLLRYIVTTYPGARITVACGPLCTDLFAAVPGLDAVIAMPKQSWNLHWWKLWRRCAPTHWDMIVDLRDSVVSRLLRRGKLYVYRPQSDKHKVLVNAAIMALDPPPAPQIWRSVAAEADAATLIPGTVPVLALGPSANWPAKQWPAAHFAELVGMLLAEPDFQGGSVLVLAAAHEREQIMPVLRAIPDGQRIELIGASLALAAACLRRARLYVGNDSGLMHLAAAVGTPTLGLFGPGNEKIYGPWGAHAATVRTPETAMELLRRLPEPGQPVPSLMGSLTPAVVRGAVLDLLKNCQ